MGTDNQLTYSAAIEELEGIVNEIETESISVDILTDKVKRATQLIKFCKSKLKNTEDEVKKVLSEIEEEVKEETQEETLDSSDVEPF